MAIRYTVTTSSCPHCGHVLKREGYPIGTLLLMVCTAFLALLWFIAIAILNKIFNYESVKVGSPYIRCPNCDNLVKTNEAFEWGSYKTEFKKNWAFRNWMRVCYAVGGLSLFSILMVIGGLINGKPSDTTPNIVFTIILIFCLAIIGFAYYKRKQYMSDKFVTVSESDYELIKESWRRLKKFEPNEEETVTIKISGSGRIIRPQQSNVKKKENVKTKPSVVEYHGNDNDVDEDHISQSPEIEIIEDKPEVLVEEKKEPTKKVSSTKHVIVARKNKKD